MILTLRSILFLSSTRSILILTWEHTGRNITELSQKAQNCEFGRTENDMLNKKLRGRLRREPKALDICRSQKNANA